MFFSHRGLAGTSFTWIPKSIGFLGFLLAKVPSSQSSKITLLQLRWKLRYPESMTNFENIHEMFLQTLKKVSVHKHV